MHRARLIGLTALLGVVTSHACLAKAPRLEFSPDQQAQALRVVSEATQDLDQAEQRLTVIYGDSSTSVRIQELKVMDQVVSKASDTPDAQLKKTGSALMRHVASFEPIVATCNLSGEAVFDLSSLNRTLSEFLQTRKVATASEVTDLTESGGADGTRRQQSIDEWDCSIVRKAFASTAPLLQDAYMRIQAIAKDQPTYDPKAAALAEKAAAVHVVLGPNSAATVTVVPSTPAAPGGTVVVTPSSPVPVKSGTVLVAPVAPMGTSGAMPGAQAIPAPAGAVVIVPATSSPNAIAVPPAAPLPNGAVVVVPAPTSPPAN